MPMPVTVPPARVPARLSQKMLLNSTGSLNDGRRTGQGRLQLVAVRRVERPAAAGWPLEVTAVAVVRFFMMVLFETRTLGASLRLMPAPSWVETLLTIMLLSTFIASVPPEPPAIRNRMPPPSSLEMFAWIWLA